MLRDRVRSYLAAEGTSPRLDALLRDAAPLDVIVTDSVVEALALENRLIKQRNPRFNILLRDDKTYPYLQLTTTERGAAAARGAPRGARRQRLRRAVHAGRAWPAGRWRWRTGCSASGRATRSSTASADRPCLEYDIKRCLAPCVDAICSLERYGHAVDQARLLIEGRQDELIDELQRRDASRRPTTSASSARRTCATRSARSRRCAIGATTSRRRRSAIATRSA